MEVVSASLSQVELGPGFNSCVCVCVCVFLAAIENKTLIGVRMSVWCEDYLSVPCFHSSAKLAVY